MKKMNWKNKFILEFLSILCQTFALIKSALMTQWSFYSTWLTNFTKSIFNLSFCTQVHMVKIKFAYDYLFIYPNCKTLNENQDMWSLAFGPLFLKGKRSRNKIKMSVM